MGRRRRRRRREKVDQLVEVWLRWCGLVCATDVRTVGSVGYIVLQAVMRMAVKTQ